MHFDAAWLAAHEFVREHLADHAPSVVLLRDLHGRIRVLLDDRSSKVSTDDSRLASDLHARLGPYSPGEAACVVRAKRLAAPEEIFDSADTVVVPPSGYRTLERAVVGSDWLRTRPMGDDDDAARPPRLTLFGIKGGVGRSTAGAVLAWKLAEAGKTILVIDLDIESPGIGTTLLGEQQPDWGVADWLVENGVGQGEAALMSMLEASPLGGTRGAIYVAPASGRPRSGYEYLPKLARAYRDVAVRGPGGELRLRSFGDQLDDLVAALEGEVERRTGQVPDLTVLDSRAGLHDVAAVALTRLADTSLLFAVDSDQTWAGYATLLRAWSKNSEFARGVRSGLQIVAALTPETETDVYVRRLRERAYDLFAETLYDVVRPAEPDGALAPEVTDGHDDGPFNFDLDDDDAPHAPLRVNWMRALQQFDPVRRPEALNDAQLQAAYGELVTGVRRLVFRGA